MAIVIPIRSTFDDKGVKEAQKGVSKTASTFDKVGAASSKMAVPAIAALGGIGIAAKGFAEEAMGAKQANKLLAASFAGVGFPQHAAEAQKFADSLSRTIGVQDEEIKATMSMLTAFDSLSKSTDLMGRVTASAADMAAKGFGSMDSAAKTLGKALEDPAKGITKLEKQGVSFTDQQKEQIKAMDKAGNKAAAQNIIMGEVEKAYGGAAEAAKTSGDDMSIAWGEAQEALGEKLLPVFEDFLGLLTKGADFLAEHTDAVLIAGGALAAMSVGVLAVNAAYRAFTAIQAAIKAIKAMNLAMLANPYVLIAAAVIALVVVIVKNWDAIKAATEKIWGGISSFLTGIWDSISKFASKIWDGIKNIVNKAWGFIKKILMLNPFIFVLTHLDWIKAKFAAAFDWVKNKVSAVWNAIKGVFKGNPFAPIKAFLDTMKGWFTSTFKWIEDKISAFLGVVNRMVDSVKKAFKVAKDTADKINPFSKAAPAFFPTPAGMVPGVAVGPQTNAASATGGGVTINVNGALDPEGVARQIRKLLDKHDQRNGRTVVRAVAF